jgi:hypothetical protein
MLYVESRKSLKVRKGKKNYFFAECQKTLGKELVCRVQKKNTKQANLPSAIILPSVFWAALGKGVVCRVPVWLHLVNHLALGKELVSGSVEDAAASPNAMHHRHPPRKGAR